MKNFFSPKEVKKREAKKNKIISDTIERYYNAIENEKIREILDKLPKTKETLQIIEEELAHFIQDVDGESETEKWRTLVDGVQHMDKIIEKKILKDKDD